MTIDYNFQGRLQYVSGGAMHVQMSAWPSVLGANWWEPTTGSFTCVAAYQAKGAASLAASYVNLANPGTNDAAPGNAPTFDAATGWTFDGVNDYLDTGVVPTTGYSVLVRFSDRTNGGRLIGAAMPTGNVRDELSLRPSSCNWYNGGDFWRASPTPTSGVMGVAGKDAYLDGADVGNISDAGVSTLTASLWIGARNVPGFPGFYLAAKIQAVAIYSTTLDATQMAEITANMNAL
jgi:hypothetical protein